MAISFQRQRLRSGPTDNPQESLSVSTLHHLNDCHCHQLFPLLFYFFQVQSTLHFATNILK